jgi:HD-like signal output (HDOD) protein
MTPPLPPSVARLVEAIQRSGDFPGMARTVGLITSLTTSEATSSATLADTILQDYGLTQKVLRLVNTAAYAQREQVTTISRAVMLMGFERIRGIATSLLVFEHLQRQARTVPLVDALNMSFFSAMLGRNIADHTSAAHSEEAFIGALFHRFGRLLVAFYLPDEYATIVAGPPHQQDARAHELLGLSFQQLGKGVAHELALPRKLTDSMARIAGPQASRSLSPGETLACVATLANDITESLASGDDPARTRAAIQRLLASYADRFTITMPLEDLVAKSLDDLKASSATFSLDAQASPFVASVGAWRLAALVAPGASPASPVDASSAGALVDATPAGAAAGAGESPEMILTQGLHEITTLLVAECAVNDVLNVALESIYRGLGVGRSRVLFLLVDPAAGVARLRFGFGHAAGEGAQWSAVPIKGEEDLFGVAMNQAKDIVIRDAQAPEVGRALPAWFTRRGVPDRYLVLLPLIVSQRAVGLIYVDGEKERASMLTAPVMNLLKLLRGQAVLAITQQSSRAATRR